MNIIKTVGIVIVAGAAIYAAIQVIPVIYPPYAWVPQYIADKAAWLYQTAVANPLGMVMGAIGTGASVFKVMSDKLTGAKTTAAQQYNNIVGQANSIQGDLATQLETALESKNVLTEQLTKVQSSYEKYRDSTNDITTQNMSLLSENKMLQEALSQLQIQMAEMKIQVLETKTPTLT